MNRASRLLSLGLYAAPAIAASATIVILATQPQLHDPAPDDVGISINGVLVDEVSLDGQRMSFTRYLKKQRAADAAGSGLHLVMDVESSSRGYALAFSDVAAADAYAASVGIDVRDRADALASGTSASARSTAPGASLKLNGEEVDLAACTPGGGTFVKMFDNSGCSGQQLSMIANDAIPNMGTYGFNDKMSSAEVGYCVSGLRVYTNSNYGGSSTTYGGGQAHSVAISGFNNNVSSATTNSSGAC